MTVQVRFRDDEVPSPRRRSLRWAEYFFLFAGLLGLDYYIWVSLDATFYQGFESWAFDQQIAGRQVSFQRYIQHEAEALRLLLRSARNGAEEAKPAEPTSLPKETAKSTSPSRSKPQPASVIGRIEVPRLQLTAMVREGVEEDTLRRAVGHVPYTPLPGQRGNVGLAGHRDTFFRKLRDIKNTDRILVSTLHGDYDYRVESIRIVAPKDVDVLESLPGEQSLTLVTCYPFNYIGSAPKRFIVRAKLIEPGPPQLAAF